MLRTRLLRIVLRGLQLSDFDDGTAARDASGLLGVERWLLAAGCGLLAKVLGLGDLDSNRRSAARLSTNKRPVTDTGVFLTRFFYTGTV